MRVGGEKSENSFKELCHKEQSRQSVCWDGGGGGRSGMRRGLLLLLMFCVFKMDKIIVCVYADGSDPVAGKQ